MAVIHKLMNTNMLASAASLSNQDLLDRLVVLAGNERHASVELVAHLVALDISLRCRAHNVHESELIFGRFDPSVVRETPENYAISVEITAVPKRERTETYAGSRTSTATPSIGAAVTPLERHSLFR